MIAVRLLLLFTVIIWGSTFVATKIMLGYVNPAELLGLRMLLGLPILGGLLVANKVKLKFTRREHIAILIGSAVITAHFLIQITGLKFTTATNTGWLISVTPLVMAVLSYFVLGERIGRWGVAGIGIATIGVILLISGGQLGSIGWLKSVGDWLVLVSAFTWALYTVAIRDLARLRNPLAVTFAVLLPTGLLTVGYLIYQNDWTRYVNMPAEPWIALLFLAILGTALAQWLWQLGVAKIGAARAGIFLYIEPLSSTALGVYYLHEPFGIFTAIGGLAVLAGVFVAQRGKEQELA